MVGDDEFATLPAHAWETLRSRVAAFEAAWAAGKRPGLQDFVPPDDPSAGQLLVELAHADLEFRLEAGEAARVEGYLAAYPELLGREAAVAGLMETEWFARRSREPDLRNAEYRDRFPQHYQEFLRLVRLAEEESPLPDEAVRVASGRGDADEVELPSVPGYEMLCELGRGGMGIVYKAVETRLERSVAVKTVRPDGGHEERERLRREATAAAALAHPNVVPVYAVLDSGGRLYVVSEFLPGGTLAERTKGEPLPGREAAAIIERLARAAAYAHQRGVVHRDLKPSNVLLAADGTPKVADFGLAKRESDDSGLTRTGVIAGSPAYMAPEQSASGKDVGPAADVYGLGAILYELLTGRPPFRGVTALDTLEQARRDEPIPLRRLVPKLSRDVETVCLKCLEKEPGKRYESADALADDLARFRRGEPVLARPVGRLGRGMRWARRNRGTAALLTLLAIAVVAGTGGSLWQASRATAAARHSRKLLFASDMKAAAEAIRNGDPVRAAELLAEHESERTGPYAFVWNHLDRLTRAPGTVIDRLDGPAYFLAFAPDAKTLAACGQDGVVRLYETDSWKLSGQFSTNQGELNGLAFSPDGTRLATAGDDGTVVLRELTSGRELWRVRVFEKQAYQVAFGLGGSAIAACGNDPVVHLIDPADGRALAAFEGDATSVEGIAVTPDGRTLVGAGYSGRATIWDLATRAERSRHESPCRLKATAASPGGKYAAFATDAAQTIVIEIESGRAVHTGGLPAPRRVRDGADYRHVAFLPDGTLAAGSDAGLIRLVAVTERGLAPATSRDAWDCRAPRFSGLTAAPDGAIVAATQDGTITVWRPNDGPAWRLVRHGGTGPPETAWVERGSHGEFRLSVAAEQGVTLFDPESGAAEALVEGDDHWQMNVASHDGRRLFVGNQTGRVEAYDLAVSPPRLLWRRRLGPSWRIARGALTGRDDRLFVRMTRLRDDSGGARDHNLGVFDAADGRLLARREFAGGVCQPAVVRGDTLVAVSDEKTVLLLDATTLHDRSRLAGHSDSVNAVDAAADGSLLASGGNGGEVFLWDLRTLRPMRSWRADDGDVTGVAFSPDGRLLLTTTLDHSPRLWDVETGRLLLEPGSIPRDIRGEDGWWWARFTPDGSRIITGARHVTAILDGRPLP